MVKRSSVTFYFLQKYRHEVLLHEHPKIYMVTFLKLLLKQGIMGRPTSLHSVQTNTDYPHLPTQSDPDSQTDPHQARNT